MVALKKSAQVSDATFAAGGDAFAGEHVGLFSSTCLGGEHAGEQVSLYSSTCISAEIRDVHTGDATFMVSSTCLKGL